MRIGYMHEREYARTYGIHLYEDVYAFAVQVHVCRLHVVGRVTWAHDLAVHQSPLL